MWLQLVEVLQNELNPFASERKTVFRLARNIHGFQEAFLASKNATSYQPFLSESAQKK